MGLHDLLRTRRKKTKKKQTNKQKREREKQMCLIRLYIEISLSLYCEQLTTLNTSFYYILSHVKTDNILLTFLYCSSLASCALELNALYV